MGRVSVGHFTTFDKELFNLKKQLTSAISHLEFYGGAINFRKSIGYNHFQTLFLNVLGVLSKRVMIHCYCNVRMLGCHPFNSWQRCFPLQLYDDGKDLVLEDSVFSNLTMGG